MITMRDAFLDRLYDIAREDRRVVLICNDFGAPSLDKFRRDLSSQFIHIGVAEQNMVNVAAGLSMAGKIVYMYSISPFMPLRCYEQIRLHLCIKNLHVNAVGVGAGYAYDLSGTTHHSVEDIAAMRALPNMTILNASDSVMAESFARITYEKPGPKYVRLDRIAFPPIYQNKLDFNDGWAIFREGKDLTIIASGYMVHQALKVRDKLAEEGVEAGVVDLYRLKPMNETPFYKTQANRIVTLEENLIYGGVGSIVSEILTDNGIDTPLLRIATPDEYCSKYGGREEIHRRYGLDVEGITKRIVKWLK